MVIIQELPQFDFHVPKFDRRKMYVVYDRLHLDQILFRCLIKQKMTARTHN